MKRHSILLLAIYLLTAACKGKSTSSSADSTLSDTSAYSSDRDTLNSSQYSADSTKSDTSKMVAADTTKGGPPSNGSQSSDSIAIVKVLYGTNRKVIQLPNHQINYANGDPVGGSTYYVGYTTISIPPDHQPGKIERPTIWRLYKEDPNLDMIQTNIVKLGDSDFNQLLKDHRAGKDAFVFVHGYNNSFQDAALRTAQIATDIGLKIVPILFSWSSQNKPWPSDYARDSVNIKASVDLFTAFLKRVATQGHYKKLHIIVHSMGNRLVSNALLMLKNDTSVKIDQLIMAAPDIGADDWKQHYAAAIVKKVKRLTIYSAKNDWALFASKTINHNLRLGEVGLPPFVVNSVDVIDAQNVKTDFLGHGRFAESETIMGDINKLVELGQDPKSRHVPWKNIDGSTYYYFKAWAYH